MKRIRVTRRDLSASLDGVQRVELRQELFADGERLWADGAPVQAVEPRDAMVMLTVGWPNVVQRRVIAIAAADYERLQTALDWQAQGATLTAATPHGRAVLTRLSDPLASSATTRWQARIELPDGSVREAPQPFSGGQGIIDAFFAAQSWVERELAHMEAPNDSSAKSE